MKKIRIIVILFLIYIGCSFSNIYTPTDYDSSIINLARKIAKKYDVPNKKYVIVIDYSKSIDEKRLFVVSQNKIIHKSQVSHGVNSGKDYPIDFGNELNSLKSSLGAYVTTSAYYGNYGYSMRVKGLDKELNSNAEKRQIVFHSNKKMKTKYSWGCFATPEYTNSYLIPLTKNGCLVYVFKQRY
jgi:hypothetical protein